MKLNLRPPTPWYSTRKLEELWYKVRYGPDWDYDREDALDRFVDKIFDYIHFTFVVPWNKLLQVIWPQDKIHIDPYDVWNLDQTLAQIIHPCLVKLNESKHGSPNVDDKDVPKHLRSTSAPPKENEWDVDDNHFARWDWVVDELIWTFNELKDGAQGDDYYHNSDNMELVFTPLENKTGYSTIDINDQKDPSKPPYYVDRKGLDAYNKRIENGLRLFGKYFRSLWD